MVNEEVVASMSMRLYFLLLQLTGNTASTIMQNENGIAIGVINCA